MTSDFDRLKLAALTNQLRGRGWGAGCCFTYILFITLNKKIDIYIQTVSNFTTPGIWPRHAHAFIYLFFFLHNYFLAAILDFPCDVNVGLIDKHTNHEYMTMPQWSDVTILAKSYFTCNVLGKCLPLLYKNRSPGKTKQDIHLNISVFIYLYIVKRINKVLKKIGNMPETAKSAPSPFSLLSMYVKME